MKRADGVADFYADFVPLPSLSDLFYVNKRVLSKIFKPYLKMLCMRLIIFYQRHISRHTCLYRPTCSQYTLESINNRRDRGNTFRSIQNSAVQPFFERRIRPSERKPVQKMGDVTA